MGFSIQTDETYGITLVLGVTVELPYGILPIYTVLGGNVTDFIALVICRRIAQLKIGTHVHRSLSCFVLRCVGFNAVVLMLETCMRILHTKLRSLNDI